MKTSWLLIALLAGFGCRHPACSNHTPLPGPRMSERTARLAEVGVREIAERLAAQQGEHIQDYEPPIITFDSATGEWWLLYELKPPGRPGGHFGVLVCDKTRDAKFVPGK